MDKYTETNILIAEFLGIHLNEDGTRIGHRQIHELEFHTNWEWIMKVFDKIEEVHDNEYFVEICGCRVEISYMINHNWPHDKGVVCEFHSKHSHDKKTNAYSAIVSFVNYYNTIEKENNLKEEKRC